MVLGTPSPYPFFFFFFFYFFYYFYYFFYYYLLRWPMVCKAFDEESPRGTGLPSIRIRHKKTTAKWKDGPSMWHLRGHPPL